MYYFGYQSFNGKVHGVKFDDDHAPSHRMCISKFVITEEEFKWATWGLLKQKYPLIQETSND